MLERVLRIVLGVELAEAVFEFLVALDEEDQERLKRAYVRGVRAVKRRSVKALLRRLRQGK
jgi:Na+/phosphate symporter